MLRTVDVGEYWRAATGQSGEFKQTAFAENAEFRKMWEAIERIFQNQYIDTADDYGLSKWEQFLKITPLSSDTFDDRRFVIKTLLMGDLPYTMRSLEQKLYAICSRENVQINYIKSLYLLEIRLALAAKGHLSAVKSLLCRILPANIILDIDLLYNRHSDLADFKHGELRRYTHDELRSSVLEHIANTERFGIMGNLNYGGDVLEEKRGEI